MLSPDFHPASRLALSPSSFPDIPKKSPIQTFYGQSSFDWGTYNTARNESLPNLFNPLLEVPHRTPRGGSRHGSGTRGQCIGGSAVSRTQELEREGFTDLQDDPEQSCSEQPHLLVCRRFKAFKEVLRVLFVDNPREVARDARHGTQHICDSPRYLGSLQTVLLGLYKTGALMLGQPRLMG